MTLLRRVKASEARQQLSGLLNEVFDKKTRVIIERSGIPVAAFVSPSDLAHLERIEAERQERFRILAQMREPFTGVPSEEIEREVARAIEEVRRENRAARDADTPT
ncbi:MAG: type II toxin-antitoxin system prevent-host-death family antitoxin [Chloroflexota bacterium]|nr:type II toxin-antitoxin system prevent-host-death family antitoxin [Chloroflexota bacterium]MDE2839189.1 type II toxin-antitoxin system prevent-host-death family antitoxin [Chloroflexota bacterium]MDE2931324.1 type II toxin-antitoxin system prevent-host-death family antitoxin [Chloroflexota bacterium]